MTSSKHINIKQLLDLNFALKKEQRVLSGVGVSKFYFFLEIQNYQNFN